MGSNPDIEMCIAAFLFGFASSGAVFFKFAASRQIIRALWKN